MEEIDRDRAAGLIGEAEAEVGARRDIAPAVGRGGRRGAGSAAPASRSRCWHRRVAAVAAIVVVPAVALGFYLKLGSPDVPDQSAFARVNTTPDHQSIASLISQVEAHLAQQSQ